jgi:hypothetical protein
VEETAVRPIHGQVTGLEVTFTPPHLKHVVTADAAMLDIITIQRIGKFETRVVFHVLL